MKIAICFSGQFRTVKDTYEKCILPNFIEPNKHHTLDFFIHSWFDASEVGRIYMSAGGHPSTSPIPREILTEVFEFYNPQKMVIERQITFDPRDYHLRKAQFIRPEFSLSKMYSSWRSNELKRQFEAENNFLYDAVVATRFDFALGEPIFIEQFSFTENNFYGPDNCPHPNSIANVYNMGNSNVMDWFSKMFFYVDNYWRVDGLSFTDEQLLYHHIKTSNITISPFKVKYYLNRG